MARKHRIKYGFDGRYFNFAIDILLLTSSINTDQGIKEDYLLLAGKSRGPKINQRNVCVI
jgi:hypothetical protein